MAELVHIPFRDGEVLAVDVDGKPWIVLRPALENIGLSYSTQWRKLQGRSWACVAQRAMQVPGDAQRRDVTIVDLRTFLMLLATVNESSVSDSVRPALVAYQSEVADVIERYWTKDSAARYEPDTLTWGETAALLRQRYGMSYTAVGLTRRLRSAGVLKQNATEPTAKFRHWLWFTNTTFHVIPHILPEMAQTLGKVEHQLQQFAGVQMRLELDGVGRMPEQTTDQRL